MSCKIFYVKYKYRDGEQRNFPLHYQAHPQNGQLHLIRVGINI